MNPVSGVSSSPGSDYGSTDSIPGASLSVVKPITRMSCSRPRVLNDGTFLRPRSIFHHIPVVVEKPA